MKILNVYFNNINSLAGESRIDFDKAPIADVGVFAITGPNGSGKTSILDAISLALYGETFRFKKPAENVMTRNTAVCFAQVEFIVSGEKYRSSWQVKRQDDAPEGKVQASQMQLVHVNGADEIIEREAHKVRAFNTEITGMDFRRFSRSIMLAQGDFAAFINAFDAERLDILERIISKDIYTDYKQQIHLLTQQAEQQLASLQIRLDEIDLMSDAQREVAELDLADQKITFSELKQQNTSLLQLQAGLQNLQKLEQSISQLQQAQAEDQQRTVQAQEGLATIAKSTDVLEFKSGLDSVAEKQALIDQTQKQQAIYQQDLQKIQDKLAVDGADESKLATLPRQDTSVVQRKIANFKTKVAQIKTDRQSEAALLNAIEVQLPEKKQTLSTVDSWLSERKKDHILIENMPELGRLKNLRNRSADIQKQLKAYNKIHKNSTSASVKNLKRLASSKKEISAARKYLEKLHHQLEFIADGHTFEEMLALHAEQKERVANFVELLSLAKVHRRFVKKGFSKRYEHFDKARLEHQLEVKQRKIEEAQNIQKILEKTVYREQLTIKLTEDRKNLEYDTPCPLCGSLTHPYTSHAPNPNDSRKALSDQSAIVKALQNDVKRISQQLAAYTKVKDKNREHAERINRVEAEWLSLCTRLNAVSDGFDIGGFRGMKSRIKKEKQDLKEITDLIKRYQGKNKEIAKQDVWIVKKQTALEKLQAKQKVLDESGQGRPQEIVVMEAELAKCMQEESSLAKLTSTILAELDEKFPGSGKEDGLYDLLSRRRQDYQSYNYRQKSLADEIAQISAKVTASNEVLHEQDQQLQALFAQIREQEIAQMYFSKLGLQAQLTGQKKTIAQLELELNQKLAALNVQLQHSGYPSLDKVRELIDLSAHRDDIQASLLQLEKNIAQYPAEIEALQKQFDAERENISTQETLEELAIQLRDKQVQMEIAQQEVATIANSLQKQQQLHQQNAQLLKHVEQQKQSLQEKQQQQQKIDAEPENIFRRRVQIAVAEKLLVLTNSFLDKINGRYHVASVPSEQGLAIEIIDNKQKQSRRAVKSLSGGETFVVSLAMALSLSEIANNGRAIDSLFIDEGFGNLDAETLYTVVSTLESLKAHGKTVGIISHVQGIKERIKAQVELIKEPNGMSRIVLQE